MERRPQAPHGCRKPVQHPGPRSKITWMEPPCSITPQHPPGGGSMTCGDYKSRKVSKAGKFSGDYLIYPTSFSQNPAATKAGCDSEQVSHCKFLFPVPFPVASASNRALGLMQICMKKCTTHLQIHKYILVYITGFTRHLKSVAAVTRISGDICRKFPSGDISEWQPEQHKRGPFQWY